jgi:hypothetical protein
VFSVELCSKFIFFISPETDIPPTAMLELQRWREGSYSLLCDNNVEREIPSVEVTVYFGVNENIMGKLEHDLDLSGVVVQSVKPLKV